jgi:hypothetical protein
MTTSKREYPIKGILLDQHCEGATPGDPEDCALQHSAVDTASLPANTKAFLMRKGVTLYIVLTWMKQMPYDASYRGRKYEAVVTGGAEEIMPYVEGNDIPASRRLKVPRGGIPWTATVTSTLQRSGRKPPPISSEMRAEVIRLRRTGLTYDEILMVTDVSVASIYRILLEAGLAVPTGPTGPRRSRGTQLTGAGFRLISAS